MTATEKTSGFARTAPPSKVGAGHDFYRCYKCHRLLTKLDEIEAFSLKSRRPGQICRCGSTKYSPANISWYHWGLPRVLWFAYLRVTGAA